MEIGYVTDHAARARARLAQQFKKVPLLGIFLDMVNEQVQALEDAFQEVYSQRLLNGVGEQLNVLGRILLEDRAGETDDVYKLRLLAKISVLRSSGTVPNILRIFKLLIPLNTITVPTRGQGGFILDLGLIAAQYLTTYLRFLHAAKRAGDNGQIAYQLQSDALSFSFAAGVGLGFGDNRDSTIGGKFAGIRKA